MSDAFKATFSDCRLVRGRKVAQLVFEVPIEEVDQALSVLGGMPQPTKEAWVGIARLDPKQTPEKTAEPVPAKNVASFPFEELPYSQQAGILCSDPSFQTFMGSGPDTERTVSALYKKLSIRSRSEIIPGSLAAASWKDLVGRYRDWVRYGSPVAEPNNFA
jgi:hypothetical protein